MDRRSVVLSLGRLILLSKILWSPGVAMARRDGACSPSTCLDKGETISFSPAVFVDRSANDVWSIRIKLAVRGRRRERPVFVRIEFATDPWFSQIVHSKVLAATRKNRFFVWYVHKNKYPGVKIYVRGVVEERVGSSGRLKSFGENDQVFSDVKEMSPW